MSRNTQGSRSNTRWGARGGQVEQPSIQSRPTRCGLEPRRPRRRRARPPDALGREGAARAGRLRLAGQRRRQDRVEHHPRRSVADGRNARAVRPRRRDPQAVRRHRARRRPRRVRRRAADRQRRQRARLPVRHRHPPAPLDLHDTELVKELAISATTELELRTARAMAEREKRWSDGQQRVLELIAARSPLTRTLTELLHVAEAHAPGMLASILLLEQAGLGRSVLRHAAGPSLPLAFSNAVDGLEVADGQGICGTAAHRREPVIVLDVVGRPADDRVRRARRGARPARRLVDPDPVQRRRRARHLRPLLRPAAAAQAQRRVRHRSLDPPRAAGDRADARRARAARQRHPRALAGPRADGAAARRDERRRGARPGHAVQARRPPGRPAAEGRERLRPALRGRGSLLHDGLVGALGRARAGGRRHPRLRDRRPRRAAAQRAHGQAQQRHRRQPPVRRPPSHRRADRRRRQAVGRRRRAARPARRLRARGREAHRALRPARGRRRLQRARPREARDAGADRSADRARQPPRVRPAPRGRDRARAAPRALAVADARRRRPLQGDQRPLRPRHGRPRARQPRRRPVVGHAHRRHARARRRRRDGDDPRRLPARAGGRRSPPGCSPRSPRTPRSRTVTA